MEKRKKKADSQAIDPETAKYVAALMQAIDAGDKGKNSLDSLLIQRPINSIVLMELARALRGTADRQRQQDAANKKHSKNKEARSFASQEWVLKRHKFFTNIDFSRFISDLVLKKFNVTVKPETVARDWLKNFDRPHHDARPADAIAYTGGRYFAKRKRLSLPSTK